MIPVNYVMLVFMLIYGEGIVNTAVFFTFEPDVIRMGEPMFLICTVDDVDTIDRGLVRQWTKGLELICHNGYPKDPIKYRETVTKQNQFKLRISNVTESDLRCNYQCRYSFETQTKMLEISEHNFEYPPANDTKALIHKNVTDENITIQLHLKKVYPLPICTVIMGDSRKPLDIVKHRKCNTYYEVYMVKILPYSIKCIDHLEVTCQLIKNYSIAVEDRETCKPEDTPCIVIAVKPENNIMIEGRDGMICCTVISNLPVMSTKWLKRNEYLQRKNDSKNCFVFAPFNRNDSGHYTCCAENNIGESNLSIELKILYPPKVTVNHTVGPNYINFTCNAAGEPNNYTFLTWEHQSEYHEHIRHFNGTKPGLLHVQRTKNLFKQYGDSGYYICRVSNGIPDIKEKTIQQGKLLVIFEDSKSLSYKSSCWQIMGSLLGGSLLFSICSHIYCILKRKKKSKIDLDVPLEVQYDEIGNINIASANISDIPNNAQESVFSIDSTFFEGTNNSVSSADSSVQRLPITMLNEDGYEHSYQMLDPENIEIHPYSTVWSNLYQNTTVFQNQISAKYAKDRVPWLIIYNKAICSAENKL